MQLFKDRFCALSNELQKFTNVDSEDNFKYVT